MMWRSRVPIELIETRSGRGGYLTIEALAAADVKAHHGSVSLLGIFHIRAHLFDDAHELMPHDVSGLHACMKTQQTV
jgi:hypothetical protein